MIVTFFQIFFLFWWSHHIGEPFMYMFYCDDLIEFKQSETMKHVELDRWLLTETLAVVKPVLSISMWLSILIGPFQQWYLDRTEFLVEFCSPVLGRECANREKKNHPLRPCQLVVFGAKFEHFKSRQIKNMHAMHVYLTKNVPIFQKKLMFSKFDRIPYSKLHDFKSSMLLEVKLSIHLPARFISKICLKVGLSRWIVQQKMQMIARFGYVWEFQWLRNGKLHLKSENLSFDSHNLIGIKLSTSTRIAFCRMISNEMPMRLKFIMSKM